MSTKRMNTALSPGGAVDQRTLTTSADVVRITHVHAYSYRVPESDPSASRRTNFLVILKAESLDGRSFEGVGESQPRSWRTGDDAGDSWAFLSDAISELVGQEIEVNDRESALDAVRAGIQGSVDIAAKHTMAEGHKHPFRGTLLGIEAALLDLIAQARGETLAQLLGQKREAAPLCGPALSTTTDSEKLQAALKKQAESYELVRLTGSDDVAENLELLKSVALFNSELGLPEKPLWLDLNGALTRKQATRFVGSVTEAAINGELPREVILEQPVPVHYGDYLGTLQQQVDSAAKEAGRNDLKVRIQGDESIWDTRSISRLEKTGHLRGINIRPAQAGGLLASLDLAEAALKQNPDTRVFLTRMVGASRLTGSVLRHLALALPRIDGAVVSSVVEQSMKMSRYTKLQAEEDTAQSLGTQEAEIQEPPATTSELRIIQSNQDDEPESDHPEDKDEALASVEVSDSDTKRDEAEDRQAVLRNEADKRRRFQVRNLLGSGVALRYEGLISDVRDAVMYPPAPAATYKGIPVTKYNDVDDLHPLGPNGSKGHLLEREALGLGLNTTRYSKGAFTATDGEHDPVPFKWSRNPLSSAAALALCTHKEATRMQLQQAGVPVPQGRTFARGAYSTAKQFVERIGYPVVVKPAMGVRGIGVVAGIQDEEQLDAAFQLMAGSKLGNQDFIVEKHVHGADYRIVVIGDEVIAAIQREPASVFGDGKSTIAELLINKNIARRRNPHLWARPAKYDAAAQHELEKAGRDLNTVLPEGEQQLLANTCSLSQGGDSIDVLDEMHPSIKEASVAAVKAMPGLYFCGVDFLLEDHTKPLDQQDAGICELNAHAAIGNCEYPMFGKGRPVAETMVKATIAHYGLEAREERAEELALHLTIRGRVTGVNFRRWLQRRAEVSGIKGWVRNVNRRTVEAVLVGPTDPVTAVAAATILGPRRAVPTAYEAKQLPIPENLEGFEIREDAPAGTRVEAIDAS